ncbi:MAG: DUF1847 domain-containing protein [Ignavibacteriales bacterium]|nr:DUF1847 domain-containing protein [Ignavibacteriales bacterium]
MDCVQCFPKYCRTTDSCGTEKFETDNLLSDYKESENQQIVRSSAALVDNGKAGLLSRLQEIIEFIKSMNYAKIGLAYCYGMEQDAKVLKDIFWKEGLKLITVSCTVGGLSQNEINTSSSNHNVSCNPIGQAQQLEAEEVEFVLLMGICLGHDILLHRNLKVDFTTFVVKDRVYNHQPHLALR